MKFSILLLSLYFLITACARDTKKERISQSNGELETKSEQLNNGDVVPDGAAETPQNQRLNKAKALSF